MAEGIEPQLLHVADQHPLGAGCIHRVVPRLLDWGFGASRHDPVERNFGTFQFQRRDDTHFAFIERPQGDIDDGSARDRLLDLHRASHARCARDITKRALDHDAIEFLLKIAFILQIEGIVAGAGCPFGSRGEGIGVRG